MKRSRDAGSVGGVRGWLLASAGVLLLVIAGFFEYAHLRAHRFLTDLPRRLGIDLLQETNGFTYSQSAGGRTIYTIHAAKAVEHKDGRYTLHDVGIVLYGKTGDRADRIYGSEFEYDGKAGVVRAAGEVFLDLQAPAPADAPDRRTYAAGNAGPGAPGEDDGRVIHVKTTGLVFQQKLGVAFTQEPIEFRFRGMTGSAKGAEFHSDTGSLVLQSDVHLAGLREGRPMTLTAAHAEMRRGDREVVLGQARYVALSGGDALAETASADRAVLHLRRNSAGPDRTDLDGSAGVIDRIDAEGRATLERDRERLTAPRAALIFNAAGRPERAEMSGGLVMTAESAGKDLRGTASRGDAEFDRTGGVDRVGLQGSVRLAAMLSGASGEGERDLEAESVQMSFGHPASGRPELREVQATGGAHALSRPAANVGKIAMTELRADRLVAEMAGAGSQSRAPARSQIGSGGLRLHVASVDGQGHTVLHQMRSDGAEQTSSAETLRVEFVSADATANPRADPRTAGGDRVQSAVQAGAVAIVSRGPLVRGKEAERKESRATSDRAEYNGAADQLTLVGRAHLLEGASEIWSERVVLEQGSGDAAAFGSVRASYLQPSAADPVHVVSARAELKRASSEATFFGSGSGSGAGAGAGAGAATQGTAGLARMWRGGSQVEAPVISLDQEHRLLIARGAEGQKTLAVRSVLAGEDRSTAGAGTGPAVSPAVKTNSPAKKPTTPKPTGVLRVESGDLRYSDEDRTAVFGGGVLLRGEGGTVRSQRAVAYLRPASASPGSAPAAASSSAAGAKRPASADVFPGGTLDRVVATGTVEVAQEGREASGQQLVYTAADGMFVMTGAPGAPPRMYDPARGTVTGDTLQFHSGDNNVVVSAEAPVGNAPKHRVRSETRVKRQP